MPTLTNTPTHLQNLFPPITHITPYIEEQITDVIRDNFYYYCFCNKSIHFISSPITILSIYANKSSYLTSFYVIGKFCCSDCNKEYYFFIPLICTHDSMGELQTAPASAHLITPANALENIITFTHKHLPTFTTSSLLHLSISNLLTTYLTYTYYKHLPTFTTKQYHTFYNLIASPYHVGETLYETQYLFKTLTTSEKETANLINDILSGSYLHPNSTNLLLHLLTLLPTYNTQYKPLTSLYTPSKYIYYYPACNTTVPLDILPL